MKPGSRSAPKNNSRLLTPGLFGDDIAEIDVWRDSPQTEDCCSARATASLGDRRSAAGKVFRGPLRRGRAAVMATHGNIVGGYANPSSTALAARKSAVSKPSVKRA